MLESEIVMKKGPPTIPALGRKRRVLTVDDNKAVQEVLTRMLSSSSTLQISRQYL